MSGSRTIPEVEVPGLAAWRTWLERHHATSPGIWLVFRRGRAGRERISYEEAVREALCFGWVDSLIRRLDEDRYARKFTPRKPSSKWSDTNRRRWRELQSAGRLRPAGRVAAPTENRYAPQPPVPDPPPDLEETLRANPKARAFFQALAPTYRKRFILWIHAAKRPDTRERRLRESLRLLEAGRKLPLK